MKNKFIKKSTLILGCLLTLLSSCTKDFLETQPSDEISQSSSYVNSANGLAANINGMHRSMYQRMGSSYGGAQGQSGIGGLMISLDARGEDLVFTNTGTWHISDVTWRSNENENENSILYSYATLYKLIRNANSIIEKGATVTGDATIRDNAIGEAYAYRAYCYYNLVQMFGKRYVSGVINNQDGVPLVVTVTEKPQPRATVEEVYALINSDLNASLTLLTGKSRLAKSHFNLDVVRGLIARVALTQGNWPLAAAQAKLARTGYALMNNAAYVTGFNKVSENEWMWGMEIVAEQSDDFGNFGAYMSRNFSSTVIRSGPKAINKVLYNSFAATDIRKKVFDPTGLHTALALPSNFKTKLFTSQKFLAVSNADSRCDVPLMRAAEMYLIEAEALARSGQEPASKIVFKLFESNRNPAYTGATTTGNAYINEIMRSRRFELWGEGFRFYDLKRLDLPMDRTGLNHLPTVILNTVIVLAGDNKWQLKIPRAEIDASNGLVKQNP